MITCSTAYQAGHAETRRMWLAYRRCCRTWCAQVKGEWKWQTDFFKDSTQWDWEEIKEARAR